MGVSGARNLAEMSKAKPRFDVAGQLGRADVSEVAVAGRVRQLPSKALTVACGGCHTACITVDGLFMWGLNEEGQLGVPTSVVRSASVPRLISTPKATFVQVACGAHHTAALSNSGEVFAWGYVASQHTASTDGVLLQLQRRRTSGPLRARVRRSSDEIGGTVARALGGVRRSAHSSINSGW